MRRRTAGAVLLVAAALAAGPVRAQTGGAPMKPAEVCFIYPGPDSALPERQAGFALGLREQRLEVGRDVVVSAHAGAFDPARLARQAADCVARNVRVIVAVASAVAPATTATKTIPIVALDLETDPVATGLAESLSHPGGNVTGIFFDFPEFSAKQIELLGEAVPGLRRLGVMSDPTLNAAQLNAVRMLATTRGLMLIEQDMTEDGDLARRFQAFADGGAQAVLLLASPLVFVQRERTAALAVTHRLPAVTMFPEFAQAGGLLAYGPSTLVLYRPLGEMAGKILRGAKASDLPIDRPARMSLVINLATAKTLGVTVPPALLGRADEVIE
jgi:putative ABC transport system substrate-binding protein